MDISQFLEMFSPISLQYRESRSIFNPWVFWSENEGSKNNSDLATLKIHENIKSVFSDIELGLFIVQLWVPVTIGGRQLLSTSDQPFAVWNDLSKDKAKYRIYSDKYKYNIDIVDNQGDEMIISGGPAIAFLNRLPYVYRRVPSEDFGDLKDSIMLPICLPSKSSCVGVLEFTTRHTVYDVGKFVLDLIRVVKDQAGLDVIHVQDLIPYTTINGLKLAKDEIKEALKVVCESHNLVLAQVWTAYEDKSHVPSSSLEDTQTNRILAIKLTGYFNQEDDPYFEQYFRVCDVLPYAIWSGAPAEVKLPLQTLQDYGSHYTHALPSSLLIHREACSSETSALAICLRSNDTTDFNYALEFVWTKKVNSVNLLEAIILTLKRCLPKFKFASGVELGDELDVIVAQSATKSKNNKIDESETFKIFQGKTSSPMPKAPEEGKNDIAPSKVACKTAAKVLSREAIEKQFGKTMKEAAENLNVSLSTFKRKFKGLGIPEWPGPNFLKRKANDSSIVQIDTDEEDNGVIQGPSTIIIDQNTLTIKAELSDDMIKFDVPISQATFVTIEKEIGMKWELSVGTYKLKYLDEEGDWILLRSDAEMRDCIKSLRKSNRTAVKIRVLPSPQPISGPSGSLAIAPNVSPTNPHGSPGSKQIDPLGPNNNQGPTNQTSGSR